MSRQVMHARRKVQNFLQLAATTAGCTAIAYTPDRAQAQVRNGAAPAVLTIARLAMPPALTIGGEGAFASIPALPLVVYEPVFGAPATERTEIRVAHDGTHLWVIADLYDGDASGIRANSLYRDRLSGDDVLGVVIDPFADNENGLWLWTTPTGVRGDALLAGDGAGVNDGWNGFWDVTVRRDAAGWYAVMRIPFSTLGFESAGDTARMGLTVYRYIARKNERHVFPAIAPEFDVHRPSRTQRIQLVGARSERPVYVTPYALGGVERNIGAAGLAAGSTRREAGLDVRLRPAANVFMDVTVNTDFAQVEADDQRVNLTRFSLFFPERRRFFQERSGVFEFVTGGSDRLFHSRRIGLRDGAVVPIVGGARMSGRAGAWDIGVLDVQTEGEAGPAENFGAARVRRRIINEHSYGGLLLTTRVGDDGSRNIALGGDAVVRVRGDDYLTVQAAHTLDRSAAGMWTRAIGSASLARIALATRRQAGVAWGGSAGWTGAGFLPGVGYTERTGISDFGANVRYIRLLETGRLRRIDPFQLFARAVLRNDDGTLETGRLEYNFDAQWQAGAELGLDLELHHEDLVEPLELPGGISIPAAGYTFPRFESSFDFPPGALLTGEIDLAGGGFYDGWGFSAGLGSRWNPSRHLELTGEYDLDLIRFPDRGQSLDVHVARLRVAAALDTRLSATAFVQYNDAARTWSSNLRMRFAFGEGHDLWLVYDETAAHLATLATTADRRTLLVKYARTFGF